MLFRTIPTFLWPLSILAPQIGFAASNPTLHVYREHCIVEDGKENCFLDVENNGQHTFYAADENYESLLLNPKITGLNLEFEVLEQNEYNALKSSSETLGFLYSEESQQTDVVYDANCDGWWSEGGRCAAGTIGGFAGASFGPIGIALGAIGGGLAGAASSCNDDEDGCGGSSSRGGSSGGRQGGI